MADQFKYEGPPDLTEYNVRTTELRTEAGAVRVEVERPGRLSY